MKYMPITLLTDSAEAGGIWPEGGVAYDVDGSFIENMATFYNDEAWQLYNDDGTINVTDSAEACAAAARPDVDEAYQNHCVQCLPSYLEEGALLTYALDGFPLYALLDEAGEEPTDLDQCRGANSFIGCFSGESGCSFEGDGAGQRCDASPSWWQKLLP